MFRRQACYYASAVFLILLFVYSVAISHRPYIGLELEYVNGQWIVTSSDPDGQAYNSGIRVGDLILKIDQGDPSKSRSAQLWGEAEGASTLEVHMLNQPNNQIINIPKYSFRQNALSDIPFEILGFVFWLLGFMAWFRRPFLAQAHALFWFNWVMGLAFVLAPASSRELLFAKDLELIIFAIVPILLVYFISFFQNETINQLYRFVRLMLIVLSIIIVIITIMQSMDIAHLFISIRKLVLVTVSIGSIFSLWNLGALLTFPKDKPETNQANILLMGIMIGFLPFVLLTAIPIIFGFQPILNAHFSSLFISVIPVTWYYAIVNKYLPDSRRFLEMLISNLVTGVMFSFAVSYFLFALKLSKTFNLELYLSTFAVVVMFILSFNLIRVAIIKLLNSYLFTGGKQTFKERIFELNQSLTSVNEEERILEEVVKTLAIEGAFIIIEDAKGQYLKKAVGIFLDEPIRQVKLENYFKVEQKINPEVKLLPDDLAAEIYISYNLNDFTCGIFLGHRYSHIKFERDKLPLIMLISSQLAQRLITTFVTKELSKEIETLLNNYNITQRKIQKLQRINSFFFNNFEQEKKSLAQDLHDGPLQLALDLNRWLDDIDEKCLIAKDNKTHKAIDHMREVIKNLNFELRSICSDLRPQSLTDLGLFYTIQILCEEKIKNESVQISLETVGISERVRLKEDVELVAFRFLQEGITNAIKHSGSSKINLRIELNNSNFELIIRDFGKGFDIDRIENWQLASDHFGLVGMKERLEGLGGELQITSAISQGTILKATIPISEEDLKNVI
jgi:two-component system, NarL family, sensor histidine kinase ComP